MITLTIIQGEPKTVVELPDGTRSRERNGVYSAARKLLARGYAPETLTLAVWSDGTPSFGPLPLEEYARWSLSETDRGGLRRVKYVPFEGWGEK